MAIKIDPEVLQEVQEEIAKLRDLLDQHGLSLIASTESSGIFLFPDNYRVCADDDPDMKDVDSDDPEATAMASEGEWTELSQLIQFYDPNCQTIIRD